MASIFKTAAQQAIADQPWHLRYKGSMLIVASGIVWIIGELARDAQIIEAGWAPALGVIATIAAFFLNRFTKDGITPSMAARLEGAGMQAHLDRPSVSRPPAYVGVHRAVDEGVDLPVYDGPTTTAQ